MIAVGGFLFCILVALGVICFSQRKLATEVRNANAKEMRNGLIVSIPIGHYDNSENSEVNGYFTNLAVDRDARNMKNLSDFLNYKFMTIDDKLRWTESEIMDFMKNKVGEEFFDEKGSPKYDGLIVSFSGHGVRNHIVSSDGKVIDRTSIHRCISNQFPKIRQFPRIFIFDACDGAGDRRDTVDKPERVDSQSFNDTVIVYDEEKDKGDTQKGTDIDKQTQLEDVQRDDEWTKSTKNPDYNLIAVHASNPGFVAKMNKSEEVGSYLTYFIAKKLQRNVQNGNVMGLGDTMDEIETLLHDAGKQQIRTEFFTQTRKLRIEKNVLN